MSKIRTRLMLKTDDQPIDVQQSFSWVEDRLHDCLKVQVADGSFRLIKKSEIIAVAPIGGTDVNNRSKTKRSK